MLLLQTAAQRTWTSSQQTRISRERQSLAVWHCIQLRYEAASCIGFERSWASLVMS